MPEGLDKLAGAIGDTLKTAPTLYEDALQPTVQEVGKFVARIPRAINAAFSGLDKWILNKEYAIDETKKLLEKKLENVDPDKIVEPEAYVAVPAIQAISYSINSEELRNLYANLLAKAMNSDTKDLVHPYFVEIIKQMSPIDALVFKNITLPHSFPVCNCNLAQYAKLITSIINRTDGSMSIFTNYAKTEFEHEKLMLSLDNLIRLGLIKENILDKFNTSSPLYISLIKDSNSSLFSEEKRQTYLKDPNYICESKLCCFQLTVLGENFYTVCISKFHQNEIKLL